MSDDFCLIHGYEHMKTQFGNPIAYCEACDNERSLISSAEKQAAVCHCGKDGHALGSVNCPVHGYTIIPTPAQKVVSSETDACRALLVIKGLIEGDWGIAQIREVVESALASQPPAAPVEMDCVSVNRGWIKHVIKCLSGPLPSGHIGDCVFLLRDQLQDILDKPVPRSSAETSGQEG